MLRYVALFVLFASVACSGSSSDDDTRDRDGGATVRDGGRDGGVYPVACGDGTCIHPLAYCRSSPTGACNAADGGCGPAEEACRDESVMGCTTPQTHECVDLPMDCDRCGACLILASPCGAQVQNLDCQSSPTEGVRVQCPFP